MVQNNPNRLTALLILIYLRQRLLVAIEQDNKDELKNLATIFGMLWKLVDEYQIQGGVYGILYNLGRAATDFTIGITWKDEIPSEEEIKIALGEQDMKS
jgi:hypothetical protein